MVAAYASLVKPYGNFIQVRMPIKGEVTINNFEMNRNRVRYSTSLIGGIRKLRKRSSIAPRTRSSRKSN